jgi:hypothetical protein
MENTNQPLIFGQMANIMAEIAAVKKEKTMMGGASYKYRGIDDVMNALHNLFANHGVVITSRIAESECKVSMSGKETHAIVKVEYTFWAKDGSKMENLGIGEGMDNRDKAISKALSQAYKNVLLQVFLIPTEDLKKEVLEAHSNHETASFPIPAAIRKAPQVKYLELENCKDKVELTAFWTAAKEYQLDTAFIAAVAKKGKSLS